MGRADHPLSTRQRDVLLTKLQPQLWLAPAPDEANELGGTRFGGAPDLRRGTRWPERAARPDLAEAAKSSEKSPWIVRQLAETVPFEFVAQIDLAAMRRSGLAAEAFGGLPATGRLSFFVDMAILMNHPSAGTQAALVLHDDAPAEALERLAVPAKFAEMDAWWRTPDPKQIKHLRTVADSLEASGQKDAAKAMRKAAEESENPGTASKPFVYPARSKRLAPLVVLPETSTAEAQLDAELAAFIKNDATSSHYGLLTTNDAGPFTSDPTGMRRTQDWLTIQTRQARMLGPPQPEQDDPRFDALADRPSPPWNQAQLRELAGQARGWRLLLQIPIADLSQENAEGRMYFLAHDDDIARGDFTKAVVVYQQT